MPDEKSDLGFGRVVAQEARGRMLSRNGTPRSHKYGLGAQRTERFYLHALDIPYFFTIDYQGFRSLIDAMGGVYVKVNEPMHYDDSWGKLHIHFDPGTYLLDGKKSLEYVRFRGGSADQ